MDRGADFRPRAPQLPLCDLHHADGARHGVYGFRPYEAYREAALAAGATQVNEGPLPILEAARFGRLANPEVVELAGRKPIETRAELWRLAAEERLQPVGAFTGTLWQLPLGWWRS